jgi:hypothetical protein
MSFTRIYDDPARIEKQLSEWTFQGRYQLDTPGPGINLPLQEDPQIRLQGWGANLQTNTVNIESDLMGLTRSLNCDNIKENDYKLHTFHGTMPNYPLATPFVEESRASHPAWMFRDAVGPRWEYPMINPQANLEKRFHDNIQTRILEKDYYVPNASLNVACKTADPTSVQYYLSKRSTC